MDNKYQKMQMDNEYRKMQKDHNDFVQLTSICCNCGYKIDDDCEYCEECGTSR